MKSRYQTDPEFRKIQIQRSILSRKKRREREKADKSREALDRKIWRKLKINKKIVKCCKVSHLAKAVNRSPRTIQHWENSGIIPKTIRYNRRRYYTEKHFYFIVRTFNKYSKNMKMFKRIIWEKWDTFY